MFQIENVSVKKPVLSEEEFYTKMENRRYVHHYQTLMDRAKDRNLDCYTEKHHIIPKCLGGKSDGKIAVLTAAEHYVAHQLLVKLFPDHSGLLRATILMSGVKNDKLPRNTNKSYQWLKERLSTITSESNRTRIMSPKLKEKLRISATGREMSKEHKEKLRLSNLGNKKYLGKKHSSETKAKIKASNIGKNLGKKASKETRAKLSACRLGKKQKPETIAKRVATRKHNKELTLLEASV